MKENPILLQYESLKHKVNRKLFEIYEKEWGDGGEWWRKKKNKQSLE